MAFREVRMIEVKEALRQWLERGEETDRRARRLVGVHRALTWREDACPSDGGTNS
jgi:hypothetical protein